MTDTIQLVTAAISIIVACGAFAAWILRRMDRCFAEAKADTERQFSEAKADTQRQFSEAKADTQRQFDEAKADTQRQFDEAKAQADDFKADTQRQFSELRTEMQRGFDQAREDRLRLERRMEDKFDAHGEQIANLRQDVGRLQGIVERTYQSRRFPVLPARSELSAADEVRETRMSYDTGHGGEDSECGGGAPASGGVGEGRGDES